MANDNGNNAWKNRIVGYGEENPNQLLANPLNFRIHPKDQQAATEGSLDTLGWIDDVIINKTTGHVVDGHLRVTLALRNNAATVPVKYVELTEEEEAQALISLDPIAAMAATDKQKLDTLIHSVQSDDKRVMEYIAELAEREGIQYGAPPPNDPGAQIDKAEELREKWGVKLGDLWKLGEHRLICGDCTDRATVEKVMGGEKAQGIFTSPPYAEQREEQYGGIPVDKYVEWWASVQEIARDVLSDNGSFFVNIKPHCENGQRVLYVFDLVLSMVRSWNWLFVDELCWKHQGMPGDYKGRFKNQFEPIYHFAIGKPRHFPENVSYKTIHIGPTYDVNPHKKTATKSPFEQGTKMAYDGNARPGNVIECAIGDAYFHAAAFPVKLPEFFINAYSSEGELWVDIFSGSGTTLIACERLSRKARCIEISPAYCAVAIQRWVDLTQGIPELIEQLDT